MKKILLILALFLSVGAGYSLSQRSILKDGVTIIPPYGSKLIGFVENGKIGFVLNQSNMPVIIEPIYDDIYNDNHIKSDFMILVSIDGKWGAIDGSLHSDLKNGPAVEIKYDNMEPFRNGVSKVTYRGETFYINKKGDRIDL